MRLRVRQPENDHDERRSYVGMLNTQTDVHGAPIQTNVACSMQESISIGPLDPKSQKLPARRVTQHSDWLDGLECNPDMPNTRTWV